MDLYKWLYTQTFAYKMKKFCFFAKKAKKLLTNDFISAIMIKLFGELAERSKAHDWKSCLR